MAKDPDAKAPTFNWGRFLLTASGWFAALFLGLLELPAKINSFADEAPEASRHVGELILLDEELTGSWTSSQPEGDVLARRIDPKLEALPGAPVHLSMRVYGGEVTGTISSGGLQENYVFSLVELEGRESGGEITAFAWDVVGGEKTLLAKFALTPMTQDGERVLRLRLMRGAAFLPKEAILWSTTEEPTGGFGEPMKRAMKEVSGADIDALEAAQR